MRGTEISLYSTLLIPVQGWRVCSLYQWDFVGAQEEIKVRYPLCHHQWLLWDSNPWLTVRNSYILTIKPRPLHMGKTVYVNQRFYLVKQKDEEGAENNFQ